MPRRSDERQRYGLGLAGASRHGDPNGGAQNEANVILNLVRYLAAEGREGVTDDERRSGGRSWSTVKEVLRWSSGRVGERTRFAVKR